MQANNTTDYWKSKGFFSSDVNVSSALHHLGEHIEKMPFIFSRFSPGELLQKPAPGKWSKQEILGHLIDSALNNLKRFTEIQFLPQPYKVLSYQQDHLVNVNHYASLPLEHLLQLWKSLNLQIAYVVRNIPEEKLAYPVDPQYENGEIKTLGLLFLCIYCTFFFGVALGFGGGGGGNSFTSSS